MLFPICHVASHLMFTTDSLSRSRAHLWPLQTSHTEDRVCPAGCQPHTFPLLQPWLWKRVGSWDHQLNGHEFEQTLGDREGQGSLACHTPWGHKERLNHNPWSPEREQGKKGEKPCLKRYLPRSSPDKSLKFQELVKYQRNHI